MKSASRQATSHQNRRSEVADDAGNARKWQATALTAVQCGYALTRVHPSNDQTPPSALPGLSLDVTCNN